MDAARSFWGWLIGSLEKVPTAVVVSRRGNADGSPHSVSFGHNASLSSVMLSLPSVCQGINCVAPSGDRSEVRFLVHMCDVSQASRSTHGEHGNSEL